MENKSQQVVDPVAGTLLTRQETPGTKEEKRIDGQIEMRPVFEH